MELEMEVEMKVEMKEGMGTVTEAGTGTDTETGAERHNGGVTAHLILFNYVCSRLTVILNS